MKTAPDTVEVEQLNIEKFQFGPILDLPAEPVGMEQVIIDEVKAHVARLGEQIRSKKIGPHAIMEYGIKIGVFSFPPDTNVRNVHAAWQQKQEEADAQQERNDIVHDINRQLSIVRMLSTESLKALLVALEKELINLSFPNERRTN